VRHVFADFGRWTVLFFAIGLGLATGLFAGLSELILLSSSVFLAAVKL